MSLHEVFAGQQIGFPILSVLIFLPIGLIFLLSRIRDPQLNNLVAVGGSVVELLLAGLVLFEFNGASADMQFVERIGLLPLLGIEYHVGVDGISVLFLPLTALLTTLAVLYAEPAVKTDKRHYLMAMLGFEAAMMGAFVSLDLILFWLFFVLELVPSYLLIRLWGTGEQRREAANYYVGFMAAGSVLMLAGIVLLGANVLQAGGAGDAAHRFDFLTLLTVPIPNQLETLVFFLLFFGFAIKAPIFPFHTWMPRVLEQGPIVGVSLFLVGIKLGTYGFLRFIIPLCPDASKEWFWLMALLGAVGMVYGSLIALVQTNLRRLLAFASLSHMGVVMLGLFSLNFKGFQGGLLQMINLGVAGAGLFFMAGFLYTRLGPPDLSAMGGLQPHIPKLTMVFLVISLATIGLPGTGGFNGEHLVMIGALEVNKLMAAAAGLGTFLTATYLFVFFQRAFMGGLHPGETSPDTRKPMLDIRRMEMVIAGVLCSVIFWIGFDSGPFLRTMTGSIQALEVRIHGESTVHAQHGEVPLGRQQVAELETEG